MDTSIKRLLEVAGVDITKGKAKELCEGSKRRILDLSKVTSLKAAVSKHGVNPSDFKKSGVYKIMFGSRGEIEEVKFIGNNTRVEVDEPESIDEFSGITKVENAYDVAYDEETSELYINISI